MNQHFRAYRPLLMGTRWMITADHPLAVQAAASLLENGAHAVDAAVMANLVMTVVRPHMCGFGGDLFALIYSAEDQQVKALDAAGFAPRGASLESYTSKGITGIPATGIHTCTVPGALAGWNALLDTYGTYGLDTLLAKTIPYARDGFPAYTELINAISRKQRELATSPAAAALFLPGGTPPRFGDIVRQPQLANSYRLIAEQGPDAFYNGKLGDDLITHSGELGGVFDHQDLADYRVIWKQPLSGSYRGYQLCTQPPPSQGIALAMQARILEHLDISSMPPDSPELVHAMVEAKKLAFADRDSYVCDPDFHDVPVDNLLDTQSALVRAKQIGSRAAQTVPARTFTRSGEDTVYMMVVDARGNAVVLIQSLYQPFGSCTMVPESGMMLHNRGRGFSMDPAHPNHLEPRKRPYHTLHPAMVLKSGHPRMLLGTPGGDGQTQTNIQLLTALIDHQAEAQGAVDAPRWLSQQDGSLWLENRFPQSTLRELSDRGHDIKEVDAFVEDMGSAQVIQIDRDRGVITGGADGRRQAYGLCR